MSYDGEDLVWSERSLRLYSGRGRVLATVEPDKEWKGMWRVRMPDGHLTDMVNLTRAKDAAVSLALGVLNRRVSPAEAPPMRSFAQPLSCVGLST
jgi:hypothetical protein